jgi:hypothetical protein
VYFNLHLKIYSFFFEKIHLSFSTFIHIILLFISDCSNALRLLELRIPKYTIKGNNVRLECTYDLENEALYSVKWYKDGKEFYRYIPRDMPPATVFILPGISVDVSIILALEFCEIYFLLNQQRI